MSRMMGPANQLAAKYMKEVRIPYNARYWKPKGSMMNPSNDIDLVLVDWINYAIEQGWIDTTGGSATTNLAYTAAATTGTVTSDTGTDATIPLATGTNAGLFPPVPATVALTSGAVDAAADYIPIWDASASAYKKILASFTTPVSSIIQENVAITGGNAGSSLRVTASVTGTTCTYSSGAYIVTFPVGSVAFAANLVVVTADIQGPGDGGGFTDWITVKFVNVDGNTSLANARFPVVQKISIPGSSGGVNLAANNSATIDNDGNPGVSWIGCTSNDITFRMNSSSISDQGYGLSFSGF